MKSISEQISEKQNYLLSKSDCLYPDELSRIGMELAVLLTNVGMEEAEREIKCNKRLKEIMTEDISVAKAEAIMKSEEVYFNYRQVKAVRVSLEETIKMIKVRIRALQNEREVTA